MRIALAVGVVLLIGVAWIPAHAAIEPWVLYDDFNSSLINPNKWIGNSGSGALGEEGTRLVQGGRLRMSNQVYNHASSNSGGQFGNNRLNVINPAAVIAMQATVTVREFNLVNCPLNPFVPSVTAGLMGAFFHVGTPGPPGNSTNDVFGRIALRRFGDSTDGPGILRVRAQAFRCDDAGCILATGLFSQDMALIFKFTPVTISLQWDQPNHQFIFAAGTTTFTGTYTVSDTSPPAAPFKQLTALVGVPNCTDSWPRGFIDASFDDVFVNASAAIP